MKGVKKEEEIKLSCHNFLSSVPYFQIDSRNVVLITADFSACKQNPLYHRYSTEYAK